MIEMKPGDRFDGRKITLLDHHIFSFAGLTGDFNPLHVDDEYAKNSTYGGRIGHGLLSLSLGLGLLSDKVEEYFLYGFDKIRFLKPVKPGVTITSNLEVHEKKEKGGYDLYQCTMKVIDQSGDAVLVAEMILGKSKPNEGT